MAFKAHPEIKSEINGTFITIIVVIAYYIIASWSLGFMNTKNSQ